MAQFHTWSIRGRRDLINWDVMATGSRNNAASGTRVDHGSSTTPVPTTILSETVHPEGHCSWCGQNDIGDEGVRGQLKPPDQQVFCSDVCFAQCRRAAFKRAKVCDWCKHVRHTVTYVDLHDGRRQLQFCSDKCRNQYKMQLFCAETSSLGVQSCSSASIESKTVTPPSIDSTPQPAFPTTTGRLITPDLWLADCNGSDVNDSRTNGISGDDEVTTASSAHDSETEERESIEEAPLNLVHSSRRENDSPMEVKRMKVNSDNAIVEALKLSSRKGKSNRKSHPSRNINRSFLPPPPFPPLLHDTPPTNSIPLHFPRHPSFTLGSRAHSTDAHLPVDTSSARPKAPEKAKPSDLVHQQRIVDSKPVLPSNFIVMQVPFLVPLPIPVPIPIPLNIHEKYLKQLLS